MELRIERAVAGGRMLARHDGAVVLVAGAIPGELVRVDVERSARRMFWARVVDVIEASPARRPTPSDPACGGMDYAHMAYPRQLDCKREVVLDAMQRIARLTLHADIPVVPSPEREYRLRARLHVEGGRAGFFREGTHTLCDATQTGQLRSETVPAIERVLASLGAGTTHLASVVVAENVTASQRVVHLEGRAGGALRHIDLAAGDDAGLTGVTASFEDGRVIGLTGAAHVTDTAAELFEGTPPVAPEVTWTRQAASFFQGNRFLAGGLARGVIEAVQGDRVADLYAGVGLFAVSLAARGHSVVAVEGDRVSGQDLRTNAEPFRGRLRLVRTAVEEAVATLPPGSVDTVVIDPPRTGASPEALRGIIRLDAPRLVYVSCDPATLARDTATLRTSGYVLESIRLFDLFPNTAHVETLAVFSRGMTGEAT